MTLPPPPRRDNPSLSDPVQSPLPPSLDRVVMLRTATLAFCLFLHLELERTKRAAQSDKLSKRTIPAIFRLGRPPQLPPQTDRHIASATTLATVQAVRASEHNVLVPV